MPKDTKGKGKEVIGGDVPLSRLALKSAIWYTVVKIIEEEEILAGVTTSEVFAASLAEAVYAQAISLGKDLEDFAKHAGRTTIGVEDVKLAARRNPALYDLMSTEATKHGLALAALRPKAKRAPLKTAVKPKPKPKPKKVITIADDSDEEDRGRVGGGSRNVEGDGDGGGDEKMEEDDAPAVKPKAKPRPRAKKLIKVRDD